MAIRRFSLILLVALALSLWSSPAEAQAATIILARHAEKAAPTGDPGLTAIGEQRARDLATALADVTLAAIITTQYRRTQLTAAPAALAAKLEPLVIQATGGITATAAVVQALDALPAGSTALVVGHSNTLGAIIAALGGPSVAELCDSEHSTLLIVLRPQGDGKVSLVRSRYGAAEPVGANQC